MRASIRSRRTLYCLQAALLLSIVGANAGASPSVLKLEFGTTPRITSDGVPSSLAIRDLEDITGKSRDKCVLAIGDDASAKEPRDLSLIMISSDLELGFAKSKDWIGIRPRSRGVDCGRVNRGESITLGLGTSIPEGRLISSATFGLSLKGSVLIDIEATTADGKRDRYEVRSGTSVVPNQGSATGEGGIFNCSARVDSGPDSDPTCEITIDQGFYDAFKLTTRNNGEWSLGNGSTSFLLMETLDCGETLQADFPSGDGVVTLTRLENTLVSACTPIPASLRWNAERSEFEFLADYRDQETSFSWEVTWPTEELAGLRPKDDQGIPRAVPADADASETLTGRIEPTTQLFLATDTLYFIDLCLGTPVRDDDGDLVKLTADENAPFPDLSEADGTQYACWLTRTIDYLGGDRVKIRETGYLQGDWTATRTLR